MLALTRVGFVIALASVTCTVEAAAARAALQEALGASDVSESRPTPADAAFAPIRELMTNLADSLTRAGGVRPDDHNALRYVREKAAEFSQQFPDDARGWAVQLQISKWLMEDNAVDELYARLAAARPDDANITISRAEYALNRNRFSTAIEALQSQQFDPATHPRAFTLMSDAFMAEHRFEEALDSLRMIPAAVLEKDPFIKVDVDEKLRQREHYSEEWTKELALRAQEDSRDDLPRAVIRTPRGEILVELFENEAPNTVANFISLAEQDFYNGTRFHRVIPNFMAQGGDPNSREGATGVPGMGGPGYTIPDEVDREGARKHFNDTLAMAKTSAPNSGGCQFYLTVTPTVHLNGIHTVFGRVLDGLDVVRALQPDDLIESITITRKREHEYVPTTMPSGGASPASIPSIDPLVDSTSESAGAIPLDLANEEQNPPTTAPTTQPQSP